jgi:phospholipid transport system substrate-binding protein
MENDLSRRRVLGRMICGAVAASVVSAAGLRPAQALETDDARALIDKLLADINAIINSGGSESAMLGRFERLFPVYADVPVIARSALGPAARTASSAEVASFTEAFQGYIARKYGRRFREFIGGSIEVIGAKPVKSYTEVDSVARLQGEAPFDVRWHVSDKAGRPLFFNIIIEGVNMLASERTEIGALLDQSGGDIGTLVATLNAL